jgi:hypothetical protein
MELRFYGIKPRFMVLNSGFMISNPGFKIPNSGFKILNPGLWYRVQRYGHLINSQIKIVSDCRIPTGTSSPLNWGWFQISPWQAAYPWGKESKCFLPLALDALVWRFLLISVVWYNSDKELCFETALIILTFMCQESNGDCTGINSEKFSIGLYNWIHTPPSVLYMKRCRRSPSVLISLMLADARLFSQS